MHLAPPTLTPPSPPQPPRRSKSWALSTVNQALLGRMRAPYSYLESKKKTGDCGSCGKGCTPCRTVCDLPSNVYAFKRNDVGSRNKAINDPAAYTHCSGTLKNDNDYWPQNAKGATTYWQNGGQNNCWAPYVCSGQSCTPASIYDGCFDSNGNFRFLTSRTT